MSASSAASDRKLKTWQPTTASTPIANWLSDQVVRSELPAGVANRATTLSTIDGQHAGDDDPAPPRHQIEPNLQVRLVAVPAAAASRRPSSVSQFGSTSTNVPRLAYQPQLRQMVTTSDFSGASHFSQRGPVHSRRRRRLRIVRFERGHDESRVAVSNDESSVDWSSYVGRCVDMAFVRDSQVVNCGCSADGVMQS